MGETELATKDFSRPFYMEGEDSDDTIMARVVLHQGDISENAGHGKHEKGTLINSATKAVIGSNLFTPVGIAWKQFICFGANRGDPILYNTRDKAEVPEGDLQWHESTPPRCQTFRNFVVIFDGEDMPVCLSFKDSDKIQKNAGKALNMMEKGRSAHGQCPGLYELEVVPASNDRGKWVTMRTRPVGDPSTELLQQSKLWFDAHAGSKVETDDNTPF